MVLNPPLRALRSGRRPRRRLALALLLAAAPLAGPAGADVISAEAVKATFLYKFAPFVEWPPSAFPTPNAPVTICIVGDDPFGPAIERAMAAQTLGPRPIAVVRMATVHAHSGCQVMYIAGSDVQSVGQALKIVRGEPVLTVTDGAEPRGVIDFAIVDGRVRFRIDTQRAADNGLQIRAPLLSLAVSVTRDRSVP